LAVRWDNYAEKPSKKVEHTGVPLLYNYQFVKEKYLPPLGTIFDFDIKSFEFGQLFISD